MAIALALVLAVASGALAGPVVVLTSTSDAFRPGDIRDSAETVSLADGDEILLNDADGMTRRLEGPYTGPLGAPETDPPGDPDLVRSLSRLVQAREVGHKRIGAIRNVETTGIVSVHAVSLAETGAHCLETGEAMDLLRPKKFARARVLQIREVETGAIATLEELTTDAPNFWPSSLPPHEGRRYQAHFPEFQFDNEAVEITFVRLDAQPNASARAGAMEAAGCRRQALMLLDQILANQ